MTSYQLLLPCARGSAKAVTTELALKKLGTSTTQHETCVVADVKDKKALIKATYTLQTPERLIWYLGHADITVDTEETLIGLETLIGTLEFKKLFYENKTFSVECHREGTHEYNSVDVAQEAGRLLKRHCKEALGFVPKVDMKNPDITFYVHIDEEDAWLGVDLLGKDNTRRTYKLYNNPHSIKGTTAASMLLLAGWKPGKTLVDPFAADGIITIEAALMSTKQSLHYYEKNLAAKKHPLFSEEVDEVITKADDERVDIENKLINNYDNQLRNINAAKKNAKIAGMEKYINFSRLDIDWIDTKHEGKNVDCIVTQPLEASKHVAEAKAKKVQEELFYACDYILTKDGVICFLCQHPEALAEPAGKYGFVVAQQEQLYTGKLPQWLVQLKRK